MAPLRTVVVDDEQLAREELCFLLEQAGDVEIIGQAGDGLTALRMAGELKPDLLFLDVQMPGLTGFEVARRLIQTELPPQLVFVTAFDQYAVDAVRVRVRDGHPVADTGAHDALAGDNVGGRDLAARNEALPVQVGDDGDQEVLLRTGRSGREVRDDGFRNQ